MTQTVAIFLDAYRELNARKLFWITMIISGLIVAVFALIGINEDGIRIVVWDVNLPAVNSTVLPPDVFYKSMFLGLGISFWLAWGATILGLVTTAGIFPDLISSGSIDLMLSKPISRLRLFLTKYTTGLLFMALQVTVFTGASFLVIGFRGGAWEPGIFLAVPVMLIFFSYLFGVCVLLGVLTRSTIAALLLTLLVWLLVFIMHLAEVSLFSFKEMFAQQAEAQAKTVERFEAQQADIETADPEAIDPEHAAWVSSTLEARRESLESSQDTFSKVELAHNIAYGVKTLLPKTSETADLLERWLIDFAELPNFEEPQQQREPRVNASGEFEPDQDRLQQELIREYRSRSVWWVMGTSLLFEAVVVGLAARVFCRRDY